MKNFFVILGILLSLMISQNCLANEKESKIMPKQTIVIETNQGNIEVELMPDIAPKACENFIGLAEKGPDAANSSPSPQPVLIWKIAGKLLVFRTITV